MATVKEVLIKARELIAEPEHWCQGWYGKDENGDEVTFFEDSDKTVKFCSLGAVRKVLHQEPGLRSWGPEYEEIRDGAIQAIAKCEKPDADSLAAEEVVINFNDTKTHEEVIAAFDCAIAKL